MRNSFISAGLAAKAEAEAAAGTAAAAAAAALGAAEVETARALLAAAALGVASLAPLLLLLPLLTSVTMERGCQSGVPEDANKDDEATATGAAAPWLAAAARRASRRAARCSIAAVDGAEWVRERALRGGSGQSSARGGAALVSARSPASRFCSATRVSGSAGDPLARSMRVAREGRARGRAGCTGRYGGGSGGRSDGRRASRGRRLLFCFC